MTGELAGLFTPEGWHRALRDFVTLFAIMDPFLALPVMVTMGQAEDRPTRSRSVNLAVFVAGLVLFIFLFVGQPLLQFLGISLSSFRIAGGILLLLVALQIALDITIGTPHQETGNFAIVPMATPLITGPGVIVTVMLLVASHGFISTILVSLACLLVTWLVLKQADLIHRVLGKQGIMIFARIMGLLLAGVAVEFIRTGLAG